MAIVNIWVEDENGVLRMVQNTMHVVYLVLGPVGDNSWYPLLATVVKSVADTYLTAYNESASLEYKEIYLKGYGKPWPGGRIQVLPGVYLRDVIELSPQVLRNDHYVSR
jgi:hypothetical protein